jgi:hypothetical protein
VGWHLGDVPQGATLLHFLGENHHLMTKKNTLNSHIFPIGSSLYLKGCPFGERPLFDWEGVPFGTPLGEISGKQPL